MSLSIDSRIEPSAYSKQNGIIAEEETLASSSERERMQDDDNLQKTVGEGCTLGDADCASERVSNRFLHSDENLDECQTDDDAEDDEHDEDSHSQKQAAFQQGQGESPPDTETAADTSSPSRSTHQWANRQLHRSVSVDDLMEYQREFRLEEVGRASSAYDLTDYQREFQAILSEHQQHDTLRKLVESKVGAANQETSEEQAKRCRRPRFVRNSIANSDLAEFKRQFCQDRAARTMRRAKSADDAKILKSKDMPIKLATLKNTSSYQWGTRSLRRAILGSDLGTFERSVRTALKESSRENSSSGSVSSAEEKEEVDMDCMMDGSCDTCASSLGMSHRDSEDLRMKLKPMPLAVLEAAERELEKEEDWGTRSLRKSLKELDLSDTPDPAPTVSPPYRSKPVQTMESVNEEELELPLDANISSPSSPWKDAPPSSNGLKMPRRVTSGESAHPDVDKQEKEERKEQHQKKEEEEEESNNIQKLGIPHASPQSRSASMSDIGPSPHAGGGAAKSGEPEFEWQLRSRFRRSISSSDIEKYQRHFDGPGMDDSGRMPDASDTDSTTASSSSAAATDDSSTPTAAALESAPTTTTTSEDGTSSADGSHPLLAPASHPLTSSDTRNNEEENEDQVPATRTPRRARRRHRRTRSDEPELHLDNVMADVAPRKPTRTTSRPISPPPPRSVVVRFADNCTQVVEIPKVSEDMKPFLFYTKRDVKRFRMNEHRRQEEQIRSYMEYLNQKENVLDASPSLYD